MLNILFFIFTILLCFYMAIFFHTRKYILDPQQTFHTEYALVLGAGLEKDGQPSDILMDRILAAAQLYQSQKVEYLVMSGAARHGKDETQAMAAAALVHGIPQNAILLDGQGFSTFESCLNVLRAYSPKNLVVVTQLFHLPRSIILPRLLGIETFGYTACNFHFSIYKTVYWYLREIIAVPFNLLKYLNYLFKR
jgi:SanA protein